MARERESAFQMLVAGLLWPLFTRYGERSEGADARHGVGSGRDAGEDQAMTMNLRLSVRIPESDDESFPAALSLLRTAPMFEIRSDGPSRVYLATFPDLVESLGQVIRLVGEFVRIAGVQVAINDQRVHSLIRFWSVLLCYQESLDAPNPQDHCLRKSARVSDVAGCPDRACVSHCQFLCTRCLELTHESGSPPVTTQLLVMAREAEAYWCPNLMLPGPDREA